MDEKQDKGDEQSDPDVRYVKYYHDLPKQYCCRAMREGIEDIEFIQYYERYDEYSFSSYNGYALAKMKYCPYCGTKIHSLRTLFSVKSHRYSEEKGFRWPPSCIACNAKAIEGVEIGRN